MKFFRSLIYNLYLLQLENYNLRKFWKLIRQRGADLTQRQPLVWTAKAKLIFALSAGLSFLTAWLLTMNQASSLYRILLTTVLWWIILNLLSTLLLTIAVILVWPLDWLVKTVLVWRAKHKLRQFKNLKIVGITGSYGKTTLKEILGPILSEKYQVLKTPENINTPVGISRLILRELTSETEILIVEMGAYQRGDIRELCGITRPDIAVVTGINQAHLELFGSIENTIAAKFEIVRFAQPHAVVVLNEDNELIKENYEKYVGSRKVRWYKKTGVIPFGMKAPILGHYVSSVISACVIIAKELGLSDDQIMRGIGKIKPIPHRLQLMENSNGVTVIDDSYNGNPTGVTEAIEVLAQFKDKRKVYITPGLVEMGPEKESIHLSIGQQLAKVADVVILIKNSVTPYIAKGLQAHGFEESKIIWFDSALEAHARLAEIIKAGDVVMFQNDWPDNYL